MSAHAEAAVHGHDHHGPPLANQSSRVDADDARDAPVHRHRGDAVRLVLRGLLLRAGRQPRRAGRPGRRRRSSSRSSSPGSTRRSSSRRASRCTGRCSRSSATTGAGLQAGLVLTILMGTAFLLTQFIEYAHVGFNTGDGAFASVFFGLTGLHGAHVLVGLTPAHDRRRPRVPRALLARAPSRRRAARDLLALRRRDVDRRLRDRLPDLSRRHAGSGVAWPGRAERGEPCGTRSRARMPRSGSSSARSSTSRRSCSPRGSRPGSGSVVFVVATVVAVVVLRGGRAASDVPRAVERAAVADTAGSA